jgi:hypothetical protein
MQISRRIFLRASAGVAGAGLVLGSAPWTPRLAAAEAPLVCPVEPQPIPHTNATPFGTIIRVFGPGPVEGIDPNTGHDPSLITDFSGIIAQADLNLSGTGTDLTTGESAPYEFHTDIRFMKGLFVAADGRTHQGAFAFL